MDLGLDIGYSHTKFVSRQAAGMFPSVVGTADAGGFGLKEQSVIELEKPFSCLVGEAAVAHSRFTDRSEKRDWWQSDEWRALFLAALTEVTVAHGAEVNLVLGLPVAYYEHDKDELKKSVIGIHRVKRAGREAQTFSVTRAVVIPQPFGILCAECLNKSGKVTNAALAASKAGVIGVGGKTTNVLSVNALQSVIRETASVNVGAWDAVRAVRDLLLGEYPDLDMRDHEIAEAVHKGEVSYYGETHGISDAVSAILRPMAQSVLSEASQLWNGGAALSSILIGGGGGALLAPYITARFPHARLVDEPQTANARGYYYLAQYANQARKAREE